MNLTEQILTQISVDTFKGLCKSDELLTSLRNNTIPVPTIVTESSQILDQVDWDVIICGGTLGIILGSAIVQRGLKVALLERGILRGRKQEWNISRKELGVFVELGLLTPEELDQAISSEFNPVRVSFMGGEDVWVEDVLNTGVNPIYLLEKLKQKFLAAGGQLLENTPVDTVVVHPDGVKINDQITGKLLLDAMGHFSPITRQGRQGQKPDAICLVVGSCAEGFPENDTADLMLSFTPQSKQCQYFWEAFPASDGRTTYMFSYMDAHPQRLSLEEMFEDYFRLMPEYQDVELNQLTFKRALFGFFPSYRQSPLKTPWSRILAVGDSSGSQSPLSFGGFGAMIRHLKRLSNGIYEAIQTEQYGANALSLLQPYQPNISVTWLFQKAMSVGINQQIPNQQINQLLSVVFLEMQKLGIPVLKPFLQDIIQFSGLTKTLLKTTLAQPIIGIKILPQVGIISLLNWTWHYSNLAIYTALFSISKNRQSLIQKLSPSQQYYFHRWIDAWKYGSGGDFLD
jgi:lycopene cyclase CruP